jgi:hypothetical protein
LKIDNLAILLTTASFASLKVFILKKLWLVETNSFTLMSEISAIFLTPKPAPLAIGGQSSSLLPAQMTYKKP